MTAIAPVCTAHGLRAALLAGAALALVAGGAGDAVAAIEGKARAKRAEAVKPQDAKIPSGVLHIVITTGTQRVTVYSDGVLAARSAVSTGVPGHPTPFGVFSVIGKERYHASNIYSGAPMPFMQRITWSGVALHQGVLPGYPASHGCIRLTGDFAQLLWRTTRLGARVVIAREELAPVEFSHAKLFVPVPAAPAPGKIAQAAIAVSDAPIAEAKEPAKADDAAKPGDTEFSSADAAKTERDKSLAQSEAKKEVSPLAGPITVFISAAEKKLFVRQSLEPIYSASVAIRESGPLGTHVFTATAADERGGLRWFALSVPDQPKVELNKAELKKPDSKRKNEKSVREEQHKAEAPRPASAAEALDRIEFPPEALAVISQMTGPGTSLIVSDHGLGDETGEGTDFVVLTR